MERLERQNQVVTEHIEKSAAAVMNLESTGIAAAAATVASVVLSPLIGLAPFGLLSIQFFQPFQTFARKILIFQAEFMPPTSDYSLEKGGSTRKLSWVFQKHLVTHIHTDLNRRLRNR